MVPLPISPRRIRIGLPLFLLLIAPCIPAYAGEAPSEQALIDLVDVPGILDGAKESGRWKLGATGTYQYHSNRFAVHVLALRETEEEYLQGVPPGSVLLEFPGFAILLSGEDPGKLRLAEEQIRKHVETGAGVIYRPRKP